VQKLVLDDLQRRNFAVCLRCSPRLLAFEVYSLDEVIAIVRSLFCGLSGVDNSSSGSVSSKQANKILQKAPAKWLL